MLAKMEKIYFTQTETLIAQTILENISLFAEGSTDWNSLRDFAIAQCCIYNTRADLKSPTAAACCANNVHFNHYSRAKVSNKDFIIKLSPKR